MDETIDPVTQHIILKIFGFLDQTSNSTHLGLSGGHCISDIDGTNRLNEKWDHKIGEAQIEEQIVDCRAVQPLFLFGIA